MTTMITIPVDDRTTTGYLALPDRGNGAGVLVLHAWWGLTDFFKEVCDRLADEGFVALAPDLYHGKSVATIDEAKHLQSALDGDRAYQDITAAIAYLLDQPAVAGDTIGVVGFSMGGSWALLLEDHIAAIVTFYGLSEPESVTAQAAFLGHFAEHDEFESIEDVRGLEEHLRASGREVSFTVYPGTHHWFFERNRPDVYDAEAAQLAWKRTVMFLRSHLDRGPAAPGSK